MLKITRMPGETIFIGDDITITYLEKVGNQIKVAINAPKEVDIVYTKKAIMPKREERTNGNR